MDFLRKMLKKGRIAFFIAPNPNLNGDYYIVGFITMKSSKPGDRAWYSKTLYWFEGDPKKSVRLPSEGKGIIKFDRNLINKLDNLVDWGKKPKGQTDARYIGERVRKNPRYISNKDAKIILQECYAKTENKIIKQILEENF